MYLEQWKTSETPDKDVVIPYLEEIKAKVYYNHPLCEEPRVALIQNGYDRGWFVVVGLRYWNPNLAESTEITWIPNMEEKTPSDAINRWPIDEVVSKFEAAFKRIN